MKVSFRNNFVINGNGSASTKNTKGNKLFNKLFGKTTTAEKTDERIQSLDNDNAGIELVVTGEVEGSIEVSVDEFKELTSYMKSDLELEKDSVRFVYNGLKKFINELADGIKTKGKEIIDSVYDCAEEYENRNHQLTLLDQKHSKERREFYKSDKDE